jgi:branched-subunit amino acid transport protein
MVTSYTDPTLWGIIVAVVVLTYLVRLSFIALFGYVEKIPRWLERTLRYVPAAVLAALVFPSVVTVSPDAGGVAVDTLVAGGLAAAVAWRTENVFATMAAGMGSLWLIRFVLFPLL